MQIADSPKESTNATYESSMNRLLWANLKCNLLIRFWVIYFLYFLDSRDLDCFGESAIRLAMTDGDIICAIRLAMTINGVYCFDFALPNQSNPTKFPTILQNLTENLYRN